MDSAALPSLTPVFDGIDRWIELAPLLPVLIGLEIVLSADNAIALAAISRAELNIDNQRKALNAGISIALILRIALILMAQWIIKLWPLQLIAGIYLISLFISKVKEKLDQPSLLNEKDDHKDNSRPLMKTILLLALTDLAFSIDSVAAAVAISDQFLLVVIGAIIGVVALRFTSGLFIAWLEVFPRLEFAGYLAVGLVGFKLLLLLALPKLVVPEFTVLLIVSILFIWGFSQNKTKIDNN